MPIVPVRGLGRLGVITDRPEFDLPPEAFTAARNVRFVDGAVRRGPAFKTVFGSLATPEPVYTAAVRTSAQDYDRVLVAGRDGRLWTWRGGVHAEVTPEGHAPLASSAPWTSCGLSGLFYVNRSSQLPLKLDPSGSRFAPLAHWPASWRTQALRSWNGMLVAIGMTEGAASYPKRFRFSTFALGNNEPATWDETDLTENAGFVDLLSLEWPLVDGLPLRDALILYTSKEAVLVQAVQGDLVVQSRQLWNNIGVLGANCVCEVRDRHIVFGLDDIIAHDGSSWESLCEGRVRRRIFANLDRESSHVAFVLHDPRSSSVWFCYRSSATTGVRWPLAPYANEAAVWDYGTDTWTFLDLPNVGAGCRSNLSSVDTFESTSGSFDTLEGAYDSRAADLDRSIVFPVIPASGLAGKKLVACDPYVYDARLAYPIEPEHIAHGFCERKGIDLDDLGSDLRTYKFVRAVYPQAKRNGQGSLRVEFSGANYPGETYRLWGSVQFPPATSHKVDLRGGGRYLGYKFTVTDYADLVLSGYDIDVVGLGRR